MTPLLSRLQTALAGRYDVERELGQGGMATVFLARDVKHNRPVAVKVLSPEIALTVGHDRFLREIGIAARLTHPHILPVFDSGVADGVLYYVMPYIQGETLRHRLQRETRLPVADALRIAREIAKALDYAHRQGVVHRDIKPENVLLEDGHAVVADFGVARAVASAGESRLTGTGLAIGTPSYMSPEQSAGDAAVDGRSDIYALGCVLYEMLAGVPPFQGPSFQSLVRQHLIETPRRVGTLRKEVSPGVQEAVERALAKTPDERWATAADFAAVIDAEVTTPGRGVPRAPASPRSRLAAIAGGAVVVAAAAFVALRGAGGDGLDPNLVAVAPFDVLVPDLALWREGLVDVLSRDLDGAGPLRSVAPTVVVRRWSGRADATSATALGKSTGARLALFGQVLGAGGDSVRVSATLYDVAAGRSLGEFNVRDLKDRIDRLADSLTMALLRELGRTRPIGAVRLASLGSPSLPAVKAFLQGEQFYRRTDWDSAVAYYERAIALDSTFALAWRRIGAAFGWQRVGGDSLSRAYHLRAGALNHGLSPRDSLLLTADSLSGVLSTGPQDTVWYAHARRLFATLAEATRRYPEDPETWYALGDARFHYGLTGELGGTRAQALDAFDRSIALDSAFGPSYIHPVDLALNRGGPEEARRYIRAYLALDPKDINARGIRFLSALLDAGADSRAAARLIDTLPASVLTHALAGGLARWPDSAETAIKVLRRRMEAGVTEPDPQLFGGAPPKLLLALLLGYRGHLREAVELMGSDLPAAYLHAALLGIIPADSADAVVTSWARGRGQGGQLAPLWWAMRGDTLALRGYARRADSAALRPPLPYMRAMIRYSASAAHGYVDLARRDTAAALRRFVGLPDSLCPWCGTPQLTRAQLLAATGRDREAAAALDREIPGFGDPAAGHWALLKGRVNERVGRREEAIEAYRFVADLWRHADPELQPYVAEARAGLERLTREPQP